MNYLRYVYNQGEGLPVQINDVVYRLYFRGTASFFDEIIVEE